ncbi:hypothetical protein SAMN05661080_05203 [Modestobacter sp. DSM 44400]|uniref:hypothetical protein n=1 Tax=Modestobacter sp. DSM 44400 TaxID=1550230 RepID=UPI00089B37BD|nr:hypothetical protein [Modestobacter sp. DSM 44400]SDY98591.1 hypothetical protein SAMN05661080_05203 [Modestobacter sp. DSM 44400]
MGVVTVTAKRLLADVVRNSGRRSTVQIPASFARISEAAQTSTPLSRLFVRGEAALKLYLTLVLLTRKPPHELFRDINDAFWANLFGFEERSGTNPAPGAGTRRVKRALAMLERDESPDGPLIKRRVEHGRGPVFTVVPPPGPLQAPYITLPLELWSRGWINVMTARALYVYVCLRLMFVSKADSDPVHVSVWERQRFAMSDDTWQRGVAELERLRLIRSDVAVVAADDWSSDRRPRKVLYLNSDYLRENDSPTKPV